MGVGDRRFVRCRRGRAPGSQGAGRQGDRHIGLARQTRSADGAGMRPRFVHARGGFLRRRYESPRRQGRQPGRQRGRRFDVCRVRALDGIRGPTGHRWLCRWRPEKRDRHSSSARQTSDAVRRIEQNAQRGAARCGGAWLCRRSAARYRGGTHPAGDRQGLSVRTTRGGEGVYGIEPASWQNRACHACIHARRGEIMRRYFAIAAALVVCVMGADAYAEAYPSKPIRLVVGFSPGGAADVVARNIGDGLGHALGQPIIIENRAGAGSSIAADNVAKSAPDGYSVLIASPASISVNPALNPKLNYRPSDLSPITKVSASPLLIVVNPATGITSVNELIAAAKKSPGKLNYATSGIGSAPHFGAVLFSRITGIDMVHVPYKGGGQAVASVVAGDTQVTFATPPSLLPMVRAGRLRVLAVTNLDRSPLMPEVPGMAEAGVPEFSIAFWYGFFVPAGTPPDIVKKLFEATNIAAQRPEFKAALAREGTEVALSRSPEDFAAFLTEDAKFWVRLVKESGATVE